MIIYKTTNKINGKIYVGKDKYNNPKYLGSGLLLNLAIQKYGKDNFEKQVIEKCDTIKNNPQLEIERGKHISQSKKGCIFSDRHKLNLSLSHKGKSPNNKGKHNKKWSEDKKIKLSKDVIDLIVKLYSKLSPNSITSVLKDLKNISVSSIVTRRILKEQGVYIPNDIRFYTGRNRITHNQIVEIAKQIQNYD